MLNITVENVCLLQKTSIAAAPIEQNVIEPTWEHRNMKTKYFYYCLHIYFCCLGFGTSHKVNNILLHAGSFGNVTHHLKPKKKRCRRSFNIPPTRPLASYST